MQRVVNRRQEFRVTPEADHSSLWHVDVFHVGQVEVPDRSAAGLAVDELPAGLAAGRVDDGRGAEGGLADVLDQVQEQGQRRCTRVAAPPACLETTKCGVDHGVLVVVVLAELAADRVGMEMIGPHGAATPQLAVDDAVALVRVVPLDDAAGRPARPRLPEVAGLLAIQGLLLISAEVDRFHVLLDLELEEHLRDLLSLVVDALVVLPPLVAVGLLDELRVVDLVPGADLARVELGVGHQDLLNRLTHVVRADFPVLHA